MDVDVRLYILAATFLLVVLTGLALLIALLRAARARRERSHVDVVQNLTPARSGRVDVSLDGFEIDAPRAEHLEALRTPVRPERAAAVPLEAGEPDGTGAVPEPAQGPSPPAVEKVMDLSKLPEVGEVLEARPVESQAVPTPDPQPAPAPEPQPEPAPAPEPQPAPESPRNPPRAPRPVTVVAPLPEFAPEEPASMPIAPLPPQPALPEHVLVSPVEMWFGRVRVGVTPGTKSYAQFMRYADELFDELSRCKGSA